MTPRQTSQQISDAIITQLETSLNTTIPLLPKSFCRVLAKALGGVFVLLYQFAGWILLQMFVKTASNEPVAIGGITITPLALWGSLVGIFQGIGQRAELSIEITVITQTGTLTSGTRVVNTNTEMIYTLVNDVALDAATKTVTIRATETGEIGNVDAGEFLDFVSPPATVEKKVEVLTRPVDGVDPEDVEVFRQHILDRFAARPQGGAYADYRDWAQEVEGVLNAYPYSGWQDVGIPNSGTGQVFVYIEATTGVDGIPTSTLIDDVADHIENDSTGLANRRNINAYVRVFPITRTAFDVEIQGLDNADDEVSVKQAVSEGLAEYFLDRGPYILGLQVAPRKDLITDLDVGGTAGRIVASYGATITGVILTVSSVVETLYSLQEGENAKIGTLTWT